MKGLIFTYTLTVLGVVYGLLRPVYGASIYIALSILKPPALWHWSVSLGRYGFYVAVCSLIGWARQGFGQWEKLRKVRKVLYCVAIYAIIQWISGYASRYSADPRVWYHTRKLTNDMLMVLVVCSLINNFKELRVYTWVIVAAAGYVAYEMNYSWYIEGYNRIWYAEFAEIDNNGMAMIFAMVVPLALTLGLSEKRYFWKVASWIWIPFLGNAVFLAHSRGAMLGMCFSAPFLIWMLPDKRRTYWILAGAVIAILLLAGPSIQERFWSIFVDPNEQDASVNARFTSWSAAWRCIQANPWLGVGPRCWHYVGRSYGAISGLAVHNVFMQVTADSGVVAGLTLLGIYLLTIKYLFMERKTRSAYSWWYPYWAAGIAAGLGTGFLCSLFLSMERVEMPYYLAMLGLATVKVATVEDRTPAPLTTMEELELLRVSRSAPAT